MLNALLNTENLYLFIAQWGVPYSQITSDGLQYDVIELRNASNKKLGKTLVWKNDPAKRDPSFSSKYYNARQHDIIFFKTIPDAMKAAQRFKFLEGASIEMRVCTDLVEPLEVDYKVDSSNKVTIEYVTPLNSTLRHSDTCIVEIIGTKINNVNRVYSK